MKGDLMFFHEKKHPEMLTNYSYACAELHYHHKYQLIIINSGSKILLLVPRHHVPQLVVLLPPSHELQNHHPIHQVISMNLKKRISTTFTLLIWKKTVFCLYVIQYLRAAIGLLKVTHFGQQELDPRLGLVWDQLRVITVTLEVQKGDAVV